MSNKRIPLKQADRDFLKIGMPAIWKRIERGQMPVALYKQGNRWFVEQDDLVAWQEQGGWGVEVPIKRPWQLSVGNQSEKRSPQISSEPVASITHLRRVSD